MEKDGEKRGVWDSTNRQTLFINWHTSAPVTLATGYGTQQRVACAPSLINNISSGIHTTLHLPKAMDLRNLDKASTYVNNLLLARGLLRDGKPVDWYLTAPAGSSTTIDDDAPKEAPDRESASTKIISLVHDLIIRRDVSEAVAVAANSILPLTGWGAEIG